jgi:sugar phosphate isomerase/epimerase
VKSPAIGINFDTGNAYLGGEDPYKWLQASWAGSSICTRRTSRSSIRLAERGKVTGTPVGCACGDGVIDWERVIASAGRRSATSSLSVECGTVEQAARSVEHLRKLGVGR